MQILILAPSEICYHPRLLKAADFFTSKEDTVFVYNAIIGLAPKQVYDTTTGLRNWNIFENDISKRTFGSRLRWLYSSLFFKCNEAVFKITGKWIFFNHGLSKSFILFPAGLKKKIIRLYLY